MSTTSQKVEFLGTVSGILSDFNRSLSQYHRDFEVVARKINVSSIYNACNKTGELAVYISDNFNTISHTMLECVETYKKNKDNVGDYKVKVNRVLDILEDSSKIRYEFTKMDVNSDGNEDVTTSNVNTLNNILTDLSRSSRTLLLDISSIAGPMKNDSDGAIRNIGMAIETVTNKVILFNKDMNREIEEFAKRYDIELECVAELAKTTSGKLADLTVSSGISIADEVMI